MFVQIISLSPGGQTFLTHRKGVGDNRGDKHFFIEGGNIFKQGLGGKNFTSRGGQILHVGGGGGSEDVAEEIE